MEVFSGVIIIILESHTPWVNTLHLTAQYYKSPTLIFPTLTEIPDSCEYSDSDEPIVSGELLTALEINFYFISKCH